MNKAKENDQVDDDVSLADGREPGNWKTRYPAEAWRQIKLEFTYLALLLTLATVVLFAIGLTLAAAENATDRIRLPFITTIVDRQLFVWLAVSVSGLIGGVLFDLKWLYHSVARNFWNEDRLLWRLSVPFASGIVALFVAFMIISNFITLLRAESLNNLYFGMGFGFLFGYFSDSVLSKLRNIANNLLGRTDPPGA